MTDPLVQKVDFKVDTRRPHSRSKLRSKVRHVLAVAAGMFPVMALFVFIRALFLIPEQRRDLYRLVLIFLACGMVALLAYAWARAEKTRRREVSARNRELKYRKQEEAWRRSQAHHPDPPAGATSRQEG